MGRRDRMKEREMPCWKLVAAAAVLGSILTVKARAGEPADQSAEAGLPPLDLAALLREAAEKSPVIGAAKSRRSAAEAIPSQLDAYPDPLVSVTYQNETFTDFTLGDSPDAWL